MEYKDNTDENANFDLKGRNIFDISINKSIIRKSDIPPEEEDNGDEKYTIIPRAKSG